MIRGAFDLLRRDFGIGLRRHRCAGFFQRRNEIENLETKLTLGPGRGIVRVRCDRAVRDVALLVDPEDLFLGHVLQQIAHAEHDD